MGSLVAEWARIAAEWTRKLAEWTSSLPASPNELENLPNELESSRMDSHNLPVQAAKVGDRVLGCIRI